MAFELKRLPPRWGPAVLIMAAIFLASSTPADNLPSFGLMDILVKKGGHFTGYFLLAMCLLRGLGAGRKKAAILALGLVFVYAVSDEFHQSFVPGRNPDLEDVLIDMAGAGLAVWLEYNHALFRRVVHRGISSLV